MTPPRLSPPSHLLPRLCLLGSLMLLAACGGGGGGGSKAAPGQWASMANPASKYCAELGGRLEIRAEQAGEAGYCHLPDGSVMEEWQLYRGKNSL
ncbi:MAG: DUF333 domain-containing protein [Gemmobacter sp.]|uniref:putative hemolysin n=1 Tax=Gemmobacter sp. TaxID=1898957 RepID=UPI001A3A3436|nr:DUF333 domain-containing protein [Gemmobacter sp.]MBL8562451.1 DUF333 domain-containing protein [Gemmobacter sp.]